MSEITRSPLFWPDNVPRTIPVNRRHPQFHERSIASACSDICAAINRLNKRRWDYDDNGVVISTNLQLRQDGLPRSDQKEPTDSGAAVFFALRFWVNGKPRERPCVLTCDKWVKVAYNLIAIAKDIDAQRSRERWGCTTMEQAFRGYLAIPERCGGKSWWELLGVSSSAGQQEIEAAYRGLAKTHHPDVGGNNEEWIKLTEAYDQALARFRVA